MLFHGSQIEDLTIPGSKLESGISAFKSDASDNALGTSLTNSFPAGSTYNVLLSTYYTGYYVPKVHARGNTMIGVNPPHFYHQVGTRSNWNIWLNSGSGWSDQYIYAPSGGRVDDSLIGGPFTAYIGTGSFEVVDRVTAMGQNYAKITSTTWGIADTWMFGSGYINVTGTTTFTKNHDNNLILGSLGTNVADQTIRNSYECGIIHSDNAVINDSRRAILLGVDGYTLNASVNTGAPRVFMSKLHLGRGTAGSLAGSGETHLLGYNITTGEVIRTSLLPGGGAFAEDNYSNISRSANAYSLAGGSQNLLLTHSYESYSVNWYSYRNTFLAMMPYMAPAQTQQSLYNIFAATSQFGIYEKNLAGGYTGWNILMGDSINLYGLTGGLGSISGNIVFGQSVLTVGAATTINGDVQGNFILGRGSFEATGGTKTQYNVIVSGNITNKVTDGKYNTIIGGVSNTLVSNSNYNVLIGTKNLSLSAKDNTASPTVYLPRVVVGRGTGGALPTTGETHHLGYNSATGAVVRTALAGGAFEEVGTNNIQPSRISYTIDWGSSLRNTAIGWSQNSYSYFSGRFDGDDNIMIGFTSPYVTAGMTADNFYRNVTISPADYDTQLDLQGATNVAENTMIGAVYAKSLALGAGRIEKNIFVTGSGNYQIDAEIQVNNGNVAGNMVFGPGIIKLKNSTTTRNSLLGCWGVTTSRNKIYDSRFNTIVAGWGNEINSLSRGNTIVGVIGLTISGQNNQTTPTVYMPRLVLGRGTGGALLTSGETHMLGYNSSTGAVVRAALPDGGAFTLDANDNLYLTDFGVPSLFTNASNVQFMPTNDSSANTKVDNARRVFIAGYNGFSGTKLYGYNVNYGVQEVAVINANVTVSAASAYNFINGGQRRLHFIGGNHNLRDYGYSSGGFSSVYFMGGSNQINVKGNNGYAYEVVSIGGDLQIDLAASGSQTIGRTTCIMSENIRIQIPSGNASFMTFIGMQNSGGYIVSTDHSNTVHMPKLRLGRGTNGALTTTGETHMLGYNSTTGEVIRTALPATSPFELSGSSIIPTNNASTVDATNSYGSWLMSGNSNNYQRIPGHYNLHAGGGFYGYFTSTNNNLERLRYNQMMGLFVKANHQTTVGTANRTSYNLIQGYFNYIENTAAGTNNELVSNWMGGRSNYLRITATGSNNLVEANIIHGIRTTLNVSAGSSASVTNNFIQSRGSGIRTINVRNGFRFQNVAILADSHGTQTWNLDPWDVGNFAAIANHDMNLTYGAYYVAALANRNLTLSGVQYSAIIGNSSTTVGNGSTSSIDRGVVIGNQTFNTSTFTMTRSSVINTTSYTLGANLSDVVVLPKLRIGRGTNGTLPTTGATHMLGYSSTTGDVISVSLPQETVVLNLSDFSTDIAVASGLSYWIAPWDGTIDDIIGALMVTAPTGANAIFDVNKNGTTVMTTNKVVIEATETSSITATTQPGITTSSFSKGDIISCDIDQIGSTLAGKGASITLLITKS